MNDIFYDLFDEDEKTVELDRFTVDRGCAACLTNRRTLRVVTSNSTGFVLIQYFLSLGRIPHRSAILFCLCIFHFPFFNSSLF